MDEVDPVTVCTPYKVVKLRVVHKRPVKVKSNILCSVSTGSDRAAHPVNISTYYLLISMVVTSNNCIII